MLSALFGMSSSCHSLFAPSMAFAAFTLGAYTATAVRGDRARGQVKLPLNFLGTAKLF